MAPPTPREEEITVKRMFIALAAATVLSVPAFASMNKPEARRRGEPNFIACDT